MKAFRGEGAYRLLLHLLPPGFRRDHGDEMVRWAREHADRTSGARLWPLLLADLGRSLAREWGGRGAAAVRGLGGVHVALRSFTRRPGFALLAVVTLGLGAGFASTVFSVVHGIILAPMPYPDAHEIVRVGKISDGRAGILSVSALDLEDLQTRNRSFASLAGSRPASGILTGGSEPVVVRTAMVSASFFEVLGTEPAQGRRWSPDEDLPGGATVAVLSHEFWVRNWGADPGLLGGTVEIGGAPFTVVGIMPPGFQPPEALYQKGTEVWIPLAFLDPEARANRREQFIQMLGRLRDGVDAEAARVELAELGREISRDFPEPGERSFGLAPLRDETVGAVGGRLFPLLGAVGLLLGIACLNVANLVLIRSRERRAEMAVRVALGARRGDVVRQLLLENGAMGLLAGALAAALTWGGLRAFAVLAPGELPRLGEIAPGPGPLLLALGTALALALVFGVGPALLTRDAAPAPGSTRRSTGSATDAWIREGVVAVEVALSIVLVVGAGLLANSLFRLNGVPLGFDPQGVSVVSVSLPSDSDDETRAFYREAVAGIGALPGVESAGATVHLPLSGNQRMLRIRVPGLQLDAEDEERGGLPVHYQQVTPEYFATMAVPVVEGRGLAASDGPAAPRVAMVNQSLARVLAPDRSPVGLRFALSDDEGEALDYEVVGVVADLRQQRLDAPGEPELFFPFDQWPTGRMEIVARAAPGAPPVLPAMRARIRELRPDLPIRRSVRMDNFVGSTLSDRRFFSMVVGGFAVFALVLSGVGVYGTLTYAVSRRRRELGVRMALGASASTVLRTVLRRGLTTLAVGSVVGLLGALAAGRAVSSMLFGITPSDPVTLASAVLGVGAVGSLAVLVPALRASRVDPTESLREE